jgi:hypothetical protein
MIGVENYIAVEVVAIPDPNHAIAGLVLRPQPAAFREGIAVTDSDTPRPAHADRLDPTPCANVHSECSQEQDSNSTGKPVGPAEQNLVRSGNHQSLDSRVRMFDC